MIVRFVSLAVLLALLTACGAAVTTPSPTEIVPTEIIPTEVVPTEVPATEVVQAATEVAPTEVAPTEVAVEVAPPIVYTIVPSESEASYAVGEVFFNENNRYFVAVGISQQIEGQVTLDWGDPQQSSFGPISVDISALQSDNGQRDNAIRNRWLQSAAFPLATFTPTAIEGLPSNYNAGEELTLTITGDLSIREATRSVTFTVIGRADENEMVGEATTQILMTDFGFDPPNIFGVLQAENEVEIRFAFVARP